MNGGLESLACHRIIVGKCRFMVYCGDYMYVQYLNL